LFNFVQDGLPWSKISNCSTNWAIPAQKMPQKIFCLVDLFVLLDRTSSLNYLLCQRPHTTLIRINHSDNFLGLRNGSFNISPKTKRKWKRFVRKYAIFGNPSIYEWMTWPSIQYQVFSLYCLIGDRRTRTLTVKNQWIYRSGYPPWFPELVRKPFIDERTWLKSHSYHYCW
jgi:hypothetical protein